MTRLCTPFLFRHTLTGNERERENETIASSLLFHSCVFSPCKFLPPPAVSVAHPHCVIALDSALAQPPLAALHSLALRWMSAETFRAQHNSSSGANRPQAAEADCKRMTRLVRAVLRIRRPPESRGEERERERARDQPACTPEDKKNKRRTRLSGAWLGVQSRPGCSWRSVQRYVQRPRCGTCAARALGPERGE